MATLDTLLQRADETGGQAGEARAWLFLQLKEPIPTREAVPATAPSAGTVPPLESAMASEAPPLDSQDVGDQAPFEELNTPAESSPAESSPAPSPPAPEPSQASTLASAPAPRSATATAALDQAFAPLEIAFPPLPSPDPPQEGDRGPRAPAPVTPFAVASTIPPAKVPSEPPAAQTWAAPDDLDAPAETVAVVDPDDRVDPEVSFDTDQLGLSYNVDLAPAAAPVPTFDGSTAGERAPFASRRERKAEVSPESEPPPASKSLESWRAWLPGAFRSRRRS